MNPRKLIKEVKFGIYKVRFFNAFLGASLVYLVSYIILMLFNLPTWNIALIISLLFFISEIVLFTKIPSLLEVENKYEILKEELRTVDDTLIQKNELVEGLRTEVKTKVRKIVDLGDFVDFKKVLSRTLSIFLLSFLIILIASLNIRLLDTENLWDMSQDFLKDLGEKAIDQGEKYQVVNSEGELTMRFKKLALTAGIAGGEQEGGEIFGDTTIIQLGNEKINIEIRPTDFEVSVDEFETPEKKDFLDQQYEDDVFLEKTFGFEEQIPQKRQEIVKRYFKNLAEEN